MALKVKVVQLYAGLDLIGSKSSVSYKEADMEVTPEGILMISKKTKKRILLPFSNIKGAELLPEDGTEPVKGRK